MTPLFWFMSEALSRLAERPCTCTQGSILLGKCVGFHKSGMPGVQQQQKRQNSKSLGSNETPLLSRVEGGGLNRGAGVVVFPRAELPPHRTMGIPRPLPLATGIPRPPPQGPRECHDPPPSSPNLCPTLNGWGGRGIPMAVGNIRLWEYPRPPGLAAPLRLC